MYLCNSLYCYCINIRVSLHLVDQLKISSSQQHVDVSQMPPPTQLSALPQQYGQPPPVPPPFAPPFAPAIDPQYVGHVVPPTGPPYGYPIANPYNSPSAPPVDPAYTNPGNQSFPGQSYPTTVPFYGQQQIPPQPPPMWSSPPQGQQQGYPSIPPFPGQYNSPSQPPPLSYHQLFGRPMAEQLPEKRMPNMDQTDVEVAAVNSPKEFKVGMKLEAVDRRFPYFVCVATVIDTREKGHEVLIHFDGWSNVYDYWCESDAIELHPVGWCEMHGWELQIAKGVVTHIRMYMHMYSLFVYIRIIMHNFQACCIRTCICYVHQYCAHILLSTCVY